MKAALKKGLERYKCYECWFEWEGHIGPQEACSECGSLYMHWMTYDPERFENQERR